MRDLPALDGDVVEVDGRGLCAIPGLVDCHTHAAFGGDRVDEFSLRAGGATYEELHARGGGILSTVRATRAAGEDGLRAAVERHRGWMRRHGTTTFEAKSGYGLDRDTELASLRAIRDAGRHADVARRARGAARVRRRRGRVPRLRARRGAARGRAASRRRPTSSSSAARSTPRRRAATSRRAATPGSRFASTATSSPRAARSRSRSSSGRARSTISRRPAPTACARSRRATSSACCCRRARSSSAGRCRPAGRSSMPGAAVALATDFNPGSAFCESLPLCCSLAATQLKLAPAEALAACTVNAAHVLGRADRLGQARAGLPRRRRPARRARLALPRVPPRRRPRRPRSIVGGELR